MCDIHCTRTVVLFLGITVERSTTRATGTSYLRVCSWLPSRGRENKRPTAEGNSGRRSYPCLQAKLGNVRGYHLHCRRQGSSRRCRAVIVQRPHMLSPLKCSWPGRGATPDGGRLSNRVLAILVLQQWGILSSESRPYSRGRYLISKFPLLMELIPHRQLAHDLPGRCVQRMRIMQHDRYS